MIREIQEELSFNISDYKFFKSYEFFVKEKDLKLTYFMYISEIPALSLLKVHDKADLGVFTLDDALKLKITDFYKQIIQDFKDWIN